MEEKQIKKAPVNEVVARGKKAAALDQDIKGFFKERDANKRDGEDMSNISAVEQELKEALYKESLKEIKLPVGLEPMFNTLFTTAKRNKVSTAGGILITKTENANGLEIEYQEVQKVMGHAFVGSEVCINFESFRSYEGGSVANKVTKKTKLEVPTVTIDGTDYLMISERDLKYIIK